MSMNHDPELDDILQDEELVRLAGLLRATRRAEPPLDEAFRSGLRRQLMQRAWGMGEERTPWWQRLTGPPALAWAGAALGILLIGSVVVFTANQAPSVNDIVITSPIADAHAVQLQLPILVSFNQPMNHPSTEKAVQITPATYVAFSWNDNTLSVHPTGGTLAPNTQYRVTIGPGATTAKGQPLTSAKTITFVTQPAASPPPSPKPTIRATPTSQLTSDHRLAAKPSGTFYTPQWSADSTTVYFVGDKGALDAVAAASGDVKTIVPDGVSFPAIAPAGDRLAYFRGGKIEILTLAGGSTTDLTAASPVTALSWANDQLLWASADGIFKAGADGQPQAAASISKNATVVSIAPDGGHAVYQDGQALHVLDLATSRSRELSGASAFLGWAPDGSRMLFTGNQETVVADAQGQRIASLPLGDVSWSTKDEILIGSDTNLYAVRPDGYGRTLLNTGTYRLPVWAPDGMTFTYVRGGSIFGASAALLPPEPAALDQAASVVSQFMNARIARHGDQAQAFLDDKGKQAYSSSGLPLVISGDATFTRDYVVVQQLTDVSPQTARFVVRLVLSKGPLDVSEYEETLTLKRDQASQAFLIDQASAGPTRDLGKGAEVVSVDVSAGSVKIVFDSDLVSDTVVDGVVVLDGNGKRVGSQSTYTNRTVVITGLDLTPGASYKLVVLTSVQDVGGRSVPAEYDLNVLGPVLASSPGPPLPEPSPGPTSTPSPAPSPSA
jgi:Tol biopolymer transport system component